MKRIDTALLCSLFALALLFSRCTKSDGYRYAPTAQFDFVNMGAKFVTTDLTVSPKDSLFFQWNVASPNAIKRVIALKNVTVLDTTVIPYASRNAFTASKKYVADSTPGVYSYIFNAYDSTGFKLGTKSIVVTVTSDYNYFTYMKLFVPDSTAKTNKTYMSATTGQTFSYGELAANAALVDFGYFYDTTTALKHTLYALNSSPVSFYDLGALTKNATAFKKVSVTMASLSSSAALRTAGITNLASGTTSRITALAQGNVILFKTAAGKYGAVSVNYLSNTSPVPSTYMALDVKIQK